MSKKIPKIKCSACGEQMVLYKRKERVNGQYIDYCEFRCSSSKSLWKILKTFWMEHDLFIFDRYIYFLNHIRKITKKNEKRN